MHKRYRITAGLLLGAISPLLLAQEDIQPVVVTATRYAYNDTDAPYASEVYTAQDIAQSGATTLYDFLGHETSVNVLPSYGNPFTQQLDMRGYGIASGYENIVVTLNGRRLNNIDGVPQLLSSIPLASIARIEITKGSGSVIYGDGAMAGAIHIYTRAMNGGTVTLSAGNHGVSATSVTAGVNNDKAALTASASVTVPQAAVQVGSRLWPAYVGIGIAAVVAAGTLVALVAWGSAQVLPPFVAA